jgi:hypothetical protein
MALSVGFIVTFVWWLVPKLGFMAIPFIAVPFWVCEYYDGATEHWSLLKRSVIGVFLVAFLLCSSGAIYLAAFYLPRSVQELLLQSRIGIIIQVLVPLALMAGAYNLFKRITKKQW